LASDVAVDVSERVHWHGSTMTLPGGLIDELGTAAQSRHDDASPPGLVLRIEVAGAPVVQRLSDEVAVA